MAKLKLTYELIEKARKLIAAGNYTETVCQYLGISKDTWYRWLKTGERQKKGIYSDFSDAVRQAEAEAEMRNVTIIQKAAQEGNLQAAIWYLERKFPDRWGRREKIQMEHSGEMTQVVKNDEATRRLLARIDETIRTVITGTNTDDGRKGSREDSTQDNGKV